MTKTPDADMLVQSSTTPDNQITNTSSSASSLNIPSTEGIASAAGKLNVIAELAGNEKLAKKAAKVQKVASQAKQGIEIAQNVLHRVQTWGQKNKVPEGVPNAAAASSGLSQLLGLSPSGLQFTLQSAGLPPTTFEVIRFNFYEHYNELFALDVEVASADAAIAFNAVLDNQATLTLWRDGKQLRQVKGIVAHFEQGDSGFHQTFYRLHIVPDMWRLGLRANSRIFQQKDIQSILTTLLSDNKVMDYRFVLRDSHPAREFCVQYRETDLNFFNRLTAEEGIFYYFDENSVLVLSDDAESLNNEILPYNLNHNAQLQEDTVNAFAHNERVRVSHAVLKDYTFKKPLWETMFHAEAKDVEAQRATYEHYDFPGRFKDGRGKQYTQYRLDSLRNDAHSGRGKSNSPCLMAGGLLQLQQHPNVQFNTLWQLLRPNRHSTGDNGQRRQTHLERAL